MPQIANPQMARRAPMTAQAARARGGIRQIKSKPGLLFDPDRKVFFKIMDTTVHAQYDTEIFGPAAGGVVAYGTRVNFAQNIALKEDVDSNFNQPRRLTAGQIMWVSRVGLYWPPVFQDLRVDYYDIQVLAESAYFLLKVNGKELLKGPAITFPSGFGWYGSTNKNNDGVTSLGLPSLNGVPPMAKKQYLNEFYDIDGSLTIQPHQWAVAAGAALSTPTLRQGTNAGVATAYVPVKMVMHGRLYSPSTV